MNDNTRKIAVITGVSSGIGLITAKKLIHLQYFVIGISRTIPDEIKNNESFLHLNLDLTKSEEYKKKLELINKEYSDISVLIHCAGIGVFGLHEELNWKELESMFQINLMAPILITRIFLRNLKKNKGLIINISSITAKKNSPLAAAYSATKAGLTQFGNSLFDEARKSGLKIVNLHPDITRSKFYDKTWFEESPDSLAFLFAEEIANSVEWILSQREGVVVSDLTIQPQLHKIQRKK